MGAKTKDMLSAALFCLLAAAGVLLLCSMNSWLYPLNPWNDVNCFATVGREFFHGKLPYRDLLEQKGPLLYALHALALWPDPLSYQGIWVMEALLLAGTLLCFHRILRLYAPEANVGWTALLAAVICASKTFCYGDSAEQICLLPMAGSMLALLRAWKTNTPLRGRDYLLHGALAGCILWIKFSLLGFHLVWMGFQAVAALVVERKPRRAIAMCLWFLGGMLLASAPWLILFGMNGALRDMVEVYFVRNIFGYSSRSRSVLFFTAKGLYKGMQDLWLSIPLLLALLGMLTAPASCVRAREKGFLMLAAAVMAVTIYGGGRHFTYYFLAFAVFLPFFPLALMRLGRKIARRPVMLRRGTALATSMAMLALGIGMAFAGSGNVRYIGYDYEDTVQGQAVALLGRDPDKTLLNVGKLDMGLYMALDARPADRWFVRLNFDQAACQAAQLACIREGRADYVVMAGMPMEGSGLDGHYVRVAELASDYPGNKPCYLYRRVERVPEAPVPAMPAGETEM